jgi:PKHD-type hydroxylase
MASQQIFYKTILPDDIIRIIERDLEQQHNAVDTSRVEDHLINDNIRKSQNSWVPSDHWVNGFIMHYVNLANRTNFLYDIEGLESEKTQYTVYNRGDHYSWHADQDYQSFYKPVSKHAGDGMNAINDHLYKNTETVRKLSFSLLLSDPDKYQGGNLQLMDGIKKTYFAPRERGALLVFDSRTPHRVQKITKGTRKSIVGWCVGPRWK